MRHEGTTSHFQAWYKNRSVSIWGVMEEAGDVINQRQAILSPCLYTAVKKNKVKIKDFSCVSYYFSSPLSPFCLMQHCHVSLPFLHGVPEWDVALWVSVFSFGFAGFCNYQDTGGKIWSIRFIWMLPCLLPVLGLCSSFPCQFSFWIRGIRSQSLMRYFPSLPLLSVPRR